MENMCVIIQGNCIIVGTKSMRGCMIIPAESAIIPQVTSTGENMCCYSRQLCWHIFYIILGKEEKDVT